MDTPIYKIIYEPSHTTMEKLGYSNETILYLNTVMLKMKHYLSSENRQGNIIFKDFIQNPFYSNSPTEQLIHRALAAFFFLEWCIKHNVNTDSFAKSLFTRIETFPSTSLETSIKDFCELSNVYLVNNGMRRVVVALMEIIVELLKSVQFNRIHTGCGRSDFEISRVTKDIINAMINNYYLSDSRSNILSVLGKLHSHIDRVRLFEFKSICERFGSVPISSYDREAHVWFSFGSTITRSIQEFHESIHRVKQPNSDTEDAILWNLLTFITRELMHLNNTIKTNNCIRKNQIGPMMSVFALMTKEVL